MTGLSAIAHDVDRQRLPSEQLRHLQPSCSNTAHVIMLNIFNSVLSQWRSRLRPAGLSALPPASCQDPAACDTGVADPGRSTSSPSNVGIYCDRAGGGNNGGGSDSSGAPCAAALPLRTGNGHLAKPSTRQLADGLQLFGQAPRHPEHYSSIAPHISSRWRSRLHLAGYAALPPANCQEPAACDTRVAAPGDPPLPSALSSTAARLEVATAAVTVTAAELPAPRHRHCEPVAVSISRQSALDQK